MTWGEFDENTPCGLCFTSGTTGAPKGVTYTHRSSFLHTLRLLQADVMAISARDSVLAVVPMFHANAWGLPFAAPAAGAKLVLPGRHIDGAQPGVTDQCRRRDGGAWASPRSGWIWSSISSQTGGELPTLERIIVGGAPLPPASMERIEQPPGRHRCRPAGA